MTPSSTQTWRSWNAQPNVIARVGADVHAHQLATLATEALALATRALVRSSPRTATDRSGVSTNNLKAVIARCLWSHRFW